MKAEPVTPLAMVGLVMTGAMTAGAFATPPKSQEYETVGCKVTGAIIDDAEMIGPIPNIAVSPETAIRL